LLNPGDIFDGRYKILHEIGRGGFGITYLAHDPTRQREVALKVASGPQDPATLEQFKREARVISRLTHKNIVDFLDLVTLENGTPAIVSEWVNGGSLEVYLERGPLPKVQALLAAEAVASGLAAAHAVGFIHRDIKPSNVLVPIVSGKAAFRQSKLADFGLAGALSSDSNQTAAGMVFGTPTHMSPEQVSGLAHSPATDVYGLGVLLYQMIYGQLPIKAKTIVEMVFKIVNEEARLPDRPALDEPIKSFIRKCLAKNPQSRPSSGAEALKAISSFLERESIPALGDGQDGIAVVFPEEAGKPASTHGDSSPGGDSELSDDELQEQEKVKGKPGPAPAPLASDRPAALASSPPDSATTVPPDSVPPEPASGAGPVDPASKPRTAPSAESVMNAGSEPFASPRTFLVIASSGLIIASGAWLAGYIWSQGTPSQRATGIALGISLSLAGVAMGFVLNKILSRARARVEGEVGGVLMGAQGRESLTQSLAIEVEAILTRCKAMEEKALGTSIAIMLNEYEAAKESDSRQKALMNAVQLLEKLMDRLQPWYVRHQKLLTFMIGILGFATGLIKVLQTLFQT
jgi:serine/threonine protein kinase